MPNRRLLDSSSKPRLASVERLVKILAPIVPLLLPAIGFAKSGRLEHWLARAARLHDVTLAHLSACWDRLDLIFSWDLNAGFAAATQLTGAGIVLCLSRCRLKGLAARSPGAPIRRASDQLWIGSIVYYVALRPLGGAGHPSLVLELVYLFIGYSVWELARLLDPDGWPCGAMRRQAPRVAALAIATAFGLASLGAYVGLWHEPAALMFLAMFGSSAYGAAAGYKLWRAAQHEGSFVRALLFCYFCGLALRPAYLYAGSWVGLTGFGYFVLMLGKFGAWIVILNAVMLADPRVAGPYRVMRRWAVPLRKASRGYVIAPPPTPDRQAPTLAELTAGRENAAGKPELRLRE